MSHIGQWAHRAGSKSHLVESQIEERYVMRCGRQMNQELGLGRRVLVFGFPTWSNPACAQCQNGRGEPPTLNTRSDLP